MTPQPRRQVTTTNHPGGGLPRLVLNHAHEWEHGEKMVFWLREDSTTIGSGLSCDIVLADLEELTASIERDEGDEYRVVPAARADVHLHGAVVEEAQVLRTGARLELGPHSLTYVREEYADHGRPFGGRVGGEAGHQRSQPVRHPSDGTPEPEPG